MLTPSTGPEGDRSHRKYVFQDSNGASTLGQHVVLWHLMRLWMTRRKWGRDEGGGKEETQKRRMTGKGKGSFPLKLKPKNNIFSFNGIGQPSKCPFSLYPSFCLSQMSEVYRRILFESWLFALGVWLRCVNVGRPEKEGTLTSELLEEAWPQQTCRVILMSAHVLFSFIPTGLSLAFPNISGNHSLYAFFKQDFNNNI